MYGQLNLFTVQATVKVYYPTPKKLNRRLWKLIKKTDNRGYSFGKFDYFGKKESNHNCITVVLFKGRVCKFPIGFCTLSFYKKDEHEYPCPGIDVWVMPYYRDMGFGSMLVNRANKISLEKFGELPQGHDKNHTHCWDVKFREEREPWPNYTKDNQLYLFSQIQLRRPSISKRMYHQISSSTSIDHLTLQRLM